jgi:hypothetical protein
MIDLLDFVLDNTARQRYALVRLFLDKPHTKFTRFEIKELMNEGSYHEILTRGDPDKNVNPFTNFHDLKSVPTILRERLNELVNEKLIIQEVIGKKVFYHLKENTLSNVFEDYNFSESHYAEIRSWIASFSKYNELPFAGLMGMLDKRSRQRYTNSEDKQDMITIVDFETPFRKDNRFAELVTEFYWAIHDRNYIKKIEYHGHYQTAKEAEVKTVLDFMPYVLKESKGQWYVVGKCPDNKDFKVIPINRIIHKYDYDDIMEFIREPFDPEEYWDGCAGITRIGAPVDVVFHVKNGNQYNNIDYIRTVPIIKGHQDISFEGEWMKVILKKVHIGPELIRVIRSFGKENVCNVTPAWLLEDLWEAGTRNTVKLSIMFLDFDDIIHWKMDAEKQLQILPQGENEVAAISVDKSLNKKDWYQVTLKNVLINSMLYFFIENQQLELGDKRIIIRDRSFLK